ncbi:MAG: tetratricopeptide repeat protein [Chloroflexota bacterium]
MSNIKFGKLFNSHLGNADRSLGWLAGRMKVSKTTVHRWVNGDAKPRNSELIRDIARHLQLSNDEYEELLKVAGYTVVPPESPDTENSVNSTLQIEIRPPSEPECPPSVKGFVERESAMAFYTDQLQAKGIAIIAGMPGVGKTTVASMLARRRGVPDKTFWYSFYRDEGLERFISKLAEFLAWNDKSDVWEMLQGQQQTGGHMPSFELLDHIVEVLTKEQFLICLDNFQFVAQKLENFIQQLKPWLQINDLAMIITARQVPEFLFELSCGPLEGMSISETKHLLTQYIPMLTQEQVVRLHEYTGGSGEFLRLAVTALKSLDNSRQWFVQLPYDSDFQQYLLSNVDSTLTEDERDIQMAIATLSEPSSREVIEAILPDAANLQLHLHLLSSVKFLLTAHIHEGQQQYTQHDLLQNYFYGQMGHNQRRTMHRRVAEHHDTQAKVDLLKTAQHYLKAGDKDEAIQRATQYLNVIEIINSGRVEDLHKFLECFQIQDLTADQWLQASIARGYVCKHLGEKESAKESFQTALRCLEERESLAETHLYLAHVCRGLGELLQDEEPTKSLKWLQQGLDVLKDNVYTDFVGPQTLSARNQAAEIYILQGGAYIASGEFELAIESVEQGQTLLPKGLSHERLKALNNLGTIYAVQGNNKEAKRYFERALMLSTQLHNNFQRVKLLHNLSILKELSGEWDDAIQDYEEALSLAERLGSADRQAAIKNSLGTIYTKKGEYSAAERNLKESLEIAQRYEIHENIAYVYGGLAVLYIEGQRWEDAESALVAAEQLARTQQFDYLWPYMYYLHAQIYLANSEFDKALRYAERSVDLTFDTDRKVECGIALRIQGQIFAATDEAEDAQACFEESFAILDVLDHYEAARTQAIWGAWLCDHKSNELGPKLLQRASRTFAELGAQHDLDSIPSY